MRIFLFSLLVFIAFQSCQNNLDRKLPIFGEKEVVEHMVDGKMKVDTIYQTIPSFSFINQDGGQITDKDFNHTIYIADFFFTSCSTICPMMDQNMLLLYKEYKGNSRVKFLSHTIDPRHDTPAVLKQYAHSLGVDGSQWQFVCGSQDAIYQIAKSYLVAAYDDQSDPQGRVHQGWFVLIDPDKRIRGAYDGTNKEEVMKLKRDVKKLLAEYDGSSRKKNIL